MTTSYKLLAFVAFIFASACAEPTIPVDRLTLPQGLKEVSGLAPAPEGGLYAIADEVGIVFHIDFDNADIKIADQFGEPAVKADFEGLAVHGGDLYALTSTGKLYKKALNQPPERTEHYATGLKKQCEFEGLVSEFSADRLWLLCKEGLKKKRQKSLTLFAWDVANSRVDEAETISVPFKSIGIKGKLHPSAVDLDNQGFHVLAARQQALLRLDRAGSLINLKKLPGGDQWHPQAEGLLVSGSTLYIADEGVSGKPTLSRYADGF